VSSFATWIRTGNPREKNTLKAKLEQILK